MVLRPLSERLHAKGLKFIPYLGDCLMIARSRGVLLSQVTQVVSFLQEAGFLIKVVPNTGSGLGISGIQVQDKFGLGSYAFGKGPNHHSVCRNLLGWFGSSGKTLPSVFGSHGQLSRGSRVRPSTDEVIPDTLSILLECSHALTRVPAASSRVTGSLSGDPAGLSMVDRRGSISRQRAIPHGYDQCVQSGLGGHF